MKRLSIAALVGFIALASLSACKPSPKSADASAPASDAVNRPGVPIEFGRDLCKYRPDHVIKRVRHGGEIVTNAGEVHKFCSVECMISYHLEGNVAEDEVRHWLVVDFAKAQELLDAKKALFINTNLLPSPGGMGISALRDEQIAKTTHFAYAGEIIGWEEVIEVVADRRYGRESE